MLGVMGVPRDMHVATRAQGARASFPSRSSRSYSPGVGGELTPDSLLAPPIPQPRC